MEIAAPILTSAAGQDARHRSRRLIERAIKYFFGGNAIVAVVVLALITIFLFREGFGFFGKTCAACGSIAPPASNTSTLFERRPRSIPSSPGRSTEIRLREFKSLTQRGLSNEQAQAALAPFDQFATAFSDAGDELNGLVSDLNDEAMGLKEAIAKRDEMVAEAERLTRAGRNAGGGKGGRASGRPGGDDRNFRASAPTFRLTSSTVAAKLGGLLNNAPAPNESGGGKTFLHWKARFAILSPPCRAFTSNWRIGIRTDRFPWYRGITAFLVWTRLDHGQFLAGLVRYPAIAGRFDHGLGGRTGLRRPDWRARRFT